MTVYVKHCCIFSTLVRNYVEILLNFHSLYDLGELESSRTKERVLNY